MVKVKKLTHVGDIIRYTQAFNKALGYSNVPWTYFASGDCYAAINEDNKIVGGFVLVPGYFNLRSILQMPQDKIQRFYEVNPGVSRVLCDFTGYFISHPKYGLKISLWLILICFFYRKKRFVYTYPVKETGLERYYGSGNPLRIHTGKPEFLPGHGPHMEEEHVEILTKAGILKIFAYRTRRMLGLSRKRPNK